MKLPDIIPPADLLKQVEGVEQGLLQAKRARGFGWIGVAVAAAQLTVIVARGDWASALWGFVTGSGWEQIGSQWPVLVPVALLAFSFLFISWNRYWLQESQEPFRYTFSVGSFDPVPSPVKDNSSPWLSARLRRDLARMMSERIGRLYLLEQPPASAAGAGGGTTGAARPSHIHISGSYIISEVDGPAGGAIGRPQAGATPSAAPADGTTSPHTWVVEVVPWVSIGPAGSPAKLAHKVRYDLDDNLHELTSAAPGGGPEPALGESPEPAVALASPRTGRKRGTTQATTGSDSGAQSKIGSAEVAPSGPAALRPTQYRQLVERVYFSVATQIYKQIREDVQRKIDLLPSDSFRGRAYFHEAEDYARSNTLDAYEEARKLYAEAIGIFDPCWRPLSPSRWRRPFQLMRRWSSRRWTSIRRLRARPWPGVAKDEVLVAKAQVGYANMLISRRSLAGLSGQRLNPIFEARPVAAMAVNRLESLPEEVPGRRETLFDAYVTLAAVLTDLAADLQAVKHLDCARSLDPSRPDQDARFQFVMGKTKSAPNEALPLIQRAVELDPSFETAQFELAWRSEQQWRQRRRLERSVADTVMKEYLRVTELNPGNISAWANLGYMCWLLAGREGEADGAATLYRRRAREAYERGLEYKEIRRETFAVDLDYGLARLAAEDGSVDEAYRYFHSAVSTNLARGLSHSLYGSAFDYYFESIGGAILGRLAEYLTTVEQRLCVADEAGGPATTMSDRIRSCVRAYVLNDYGEACYRYHIRTGNETRLKQARDAFMQAATLNHTYVLPYYNLHQLSSFTDDRTAATTYLDRVVEIEPDWTDARLTRALIPARTYLDANRYRDRAAASRREAEERRRQAAEIRSRIDAPEGAHERERRQPPSRGLVAENVGASQSSGTVDWASRLAAAHRLEAQADDSEAEATEWELAANELPKEHSTAAKEARMELARLIPHAWIWNGSLDRDTGAEGFLAGLERALDRNDYALELKWERELDELQAKVLRALTQILLSTDDPNDRRIGEKLRCHFDRHFWPDDFELLQTQSSSPQNLEKIRHATDSSLKADPMWWLHTWVAYDRALFDREVSWQTTLRSARLPNLANHMYLWLGEQLDLLRQAETDLSSSEPRSTSASGPLPPSDDRRDAVLEVYRRVMETTSVSLLLELGQKFEKLEQWSDARSSYQRALELDQLPGVAETSRRHHAEYYHLRIGLALWNSRSYEQAIQQLSLVDGASGELLPTWRDDLVANVVDGIDTPEAYRRLRSWLVQQERQRQQEGDDAGAADARRACRRLADARYRDVCHLASTHPLSTHVREAPRPLRPIVVDADEKLFPEGADTVGVKRLLSRDIPALRERILTLTGVHLPNVTIAAKTDAEPGEYELKLHEASIGRGSVELDGMYSSRPDACASLGIFGREVSWLNGRRAGIWLRNDEVSQARNAGLELLDPYAFMLLHLELLVRQHLPTLLGVDETSSMVDEVGGDDLDDDARARLTQVLRRLVSESVPVHEVAAILQAFAESHEKYLADLTPVVEHVRMALRASLPANRGQSQLVGLSRRFEQAVANGVRECAGKRFLALPPTEACELLHAVRAGVRNPRHVDAVLVVREAGLRPFVRRLVERELPEIPVMAARELWDEWSTFDHWIR